MQILLEMQHIRSANSTCFYRSFGLGTQFSASTDSAPFPQVL
jgi:hypothetical protein